MAEEEVIIPESNWGRRVGAYFIDLLLVFMLTYAIFLMFIANFLIFLPFPMDNLVLFLVFWLIVGVISIIYSGALEGAIGATVGKGIMALEVYSLDTETMTMGKGFTRSVSKLNFIFAGADVGAGKDKGDPRQRALDITANTIVADFMPVEIQMPEPRPSGIYCKPIEDKEDDDDEYKDFPIPKELLSGRCPYCSTPYNIVPTKDKSTWSGLWGSRCIWCNKKVLGEIKSRVQPGKWV